MKKFFAVLVLFLAVAAHGQIGTTNLYGNGSSSGVADDFQVNGTLKLGNTAAGIPHDLLGWTLASATIPVDGKAWDANGLGDSSDILFLKGKYWACFSGYTNGSLASAESVGCWSGQSVTTMQPYGGNPVWTNNQSYAYASSCAEGPDLNTDGTYVYMNIIAFSATSKTDKYGTTFGCDGRGQGSLIIMRTTVAAFPAGWTAQPATPQIPQPPNTTWLYRGDVIEHAGICYMYANLGDAAAHFVIGYFTTPGTCAATELSGPWTYQGTAISAGIPGGGQSWELFDQVELQDPQIIFDHESGLYIMVYTGGLNKLGYAYTDNPAANNWTRYVGNPIPFDSIPWFPRVVKDASGQWWAIVNTNNGTPAQIYKGTGPVTTTGCNLAAQIIPYGKAGNRVWGCQVDGGGGLQIGYKTISADAEYLYYKPVTGGGAPGPQLTPAMILEGAITTPTSGYVYKSVHFADSAYFGTYNHTGSGGYGPSTQVGYDAALNTGFIQSADWGVAPKNLSINPDGGKVSVGADFASVGSVTAGAPVTGTTPTGGGIIMGPYVSDPTHSAVVTNTSVSADPTKYSLLQDYTGRSYLNSAATYPLSLRIGNVDKFVVNADGTVTAPYLSGSGNALACIDAAGKLYRGTATTCP